MNDLKPLPPATLARNVRTSVDEYSPPAVTQSPEVDGVFDGGDFEGSKFSDITRRYPDYAKHHYKKIRKKGCSYLYHHYLMGVGFKAIRALFN